MPHFPRETLRPAVRPLIHMIPALAVALGAGGFEAIIYVDRDGNASSGVRAGHFSCGSSSSRLPATASSAASSRPSAMRFNLRQELFSRGAVQTRPSQPVSFQGTRMEMRRSG